MSDLRITAVVPNYNHAQYLPRSIGALLNQSVLPHEILVVDDGSTDNSLVVLEDLARKHSILRVLRNEHNLGVNTSMNRGLAVAQGEYVLFPGADDEVRPGLFEHAARMFRQHPEAGVCSGLCEWHCNQTHLTWYGRGSMSESPRYFSPAEMIAAGRRGRLAINNQNAIFKKAALVEAGGWIPELRWFADWFGGYVVGFRYGMCHVPEVLSVLYLNPKSYYNAKADAGAERRGVMSQMLDLLENDKYADVTPLIRDSGLLGEFGWSMVRVVARQRRHRRFLTTSFSRHAARRCAEIIGRRFFPNWLAKASLKVFYGRG